MTRRDNTITYPLQARSTLSREQETTIKEAIGLLENKLRRSAALTNSDMVKQYCMLQIAHLLDEHFGCMFLDNQHRLIHYETLFNGTIDGAAIYPRVVVRAALLLNAAAVIFTHNHPSGLPEPSQADIDITRRLKSALGTIDIRVLDHLVVGSEGTVSFAERGLL